ncbi:hypothetical protein GmHk_U059362 [Glycine max]|nr:hypothetical protein GmHk_U059362 [Glycine max]
MAEDHPQRMTLEDYSSFATPQYLTSIARLDVQAANISYPHSLIQLIQGNIFHGLPRVPEDAIHLNLFSFSLASEAKRWLHSFKGNSLWTWEAMVEKFLKKYFPKSKTA